MRAPKIPTGRRAKKFQLPVAEDSPERGLSVWTQLLLRLVQSSCVPLREPPGAEVDFDAVLSQRAAAQALLTQLTGGLLQRLLLNSRTRDEEMRSILDEHIDELLIVAFKPPCPGALALVRMFVQQLIGLLQPERRKAVEVSVREFALKLLSKIVVRLWHHHSEASRTHVQMPTWHEKPKGVAKEQRLLQHIALRVSLGEPRAGEMPWNEAAKAVEAWDAELFLKHEDGDQTGLASFTDDIVFMYLTMAHLEDERSAPARCPPGKAGSSAVSAAVFSAVHPVHAWSFLACDWAEQCARRAKLAASDAAEASAGQAQAEEATKKRKKGKAAVLDHQQVVERFLATAWTSPTPLCGEGGSWRGGSGGGRRVLLPFTVYKVYRQLRCAELEGIRQACIDCVVTYMCVYLSLSIYTYIYIYMYTQMHIYIYIYT